MTFFKRLCSLVLKEVRREQKPCEDRSTGQAKDPLEFIFEGSNVSHRRHYEGFYQDGVYQGSTQGRSIRNVPSLTVMSIDRVVHFCRREISIRQNQLQRTWYVEAGNESDVDVISHYEVSRPTRETDGLCRRLCEGDDGNVLPQGSTLGLTADGGALAPLLALIASYEDSCESETCEESNEEPFLSEVPSIIDAEYDEAELVSNAQYQQSELCPSDEALAGQAQEDDFIAEDMFGTGDGTIVFCSQSDDSDELELLEAA